MEINILCTYSMLQKRLKGPQRGWGGERVRGVLRIYQACIVHKKVKGFQWHFGGTWKGISRTWRDLKAGKNGQFCQSLATSAYITTHYLTRSKPEGGSGAGHSLPKHSNIGTVFSPNMLAWMSHSRR